MERSKASLREARLHGSVWLQIGLPVLRGKLPLLPSLPILKSGKVISNPSFNSTLTKVARHGPISSMIVISRDFVRENN